MRVLQSALAHLNAGRLDEAVAHLEVLQRTAADHPAVLQLGATIALRDGRPGEALILAGESLRRRPGHLPSLVLASRAARAAGKAAEAASAARQAVDLAPAQAEPAFLLCHALLDLGDPTLAAAMARARRDFPGQAAAWQELGAALHRAGRAVTALDCFTLAAAADPGLAPAQFARGLLLRDAGRLAEAREALRRAATINAGASGAWFALGLTLQDMNDEAGAADAFEAALRARADFAEAAVNLGIARQRLGDMDAAVAAYRRAVHIRPDTFPRIAQAATAAATGTLWLDLDAFRRWLAG